MWIIEDPMMTMGAGDLIYHPTNHCHYQITSVDSTYVTFRPCLFDSNTYGDPQTVERATLKGLVLIPLASG